MKKQLASVAFSCIVNLHGSHYSPKDRKEIFGIENHKARIATSDLFDAIAAADPQKVTESIERGARLTAKLAGNTAVMFAQQTMDECQNYTDTLTPTLCGIIELLKNAYPEPPLSDLPQSPSCDRRRRSNPWSMGYRDRREEEKQKSNADFLNALSRDAVEEIPKMIEEQNKETYLSVLHSYDHSKKMAVVRAALHNKGPHRLAIIDHLLNESHDLSAMLLMEAARTRDFTTTFHILYHEDTDYRFNGQRGDKYRATKKALICSLGLLFTRFEKINEHEISSPHQFGDERPLRPAKDALPAFVKTINPVLKKREEQWNVPLHDTGDEMETLRTKVREQQAEKYKHSHAGNAYRRSVYPDNRSNFIATTLSHLRSGFIRPLEKMQDGRTVLEEAQNVGENHKGRRTNPIALLMENYVKDPARYQRAEDRKTEEEICSPQ